MKNKSLSFTICIPVYKGSHLLHDSLESILSQKFSQKLEIIIGEDTPPEYKEEIKKTCEIVRSFNDSRIKLIKNNHNIGYARNLQNITNLAKGDILFLMAQDDILSKNSLQKVYEAFLLDEDIGAVTRPYFWFMDKKTMQPVRIVSPYDPNNNSVLDSDNQNNFMKVFESVGQLSGLAYRRKFLTVPFNDECFPAHIYPFAGIFRDHKVVFLKDYILAVGVMDSQTRSVSSIYDLSPTKSWIKMYKTVFADGKYTKQRKWGIKHICGNNFEGLIQLKNYANKGVLWKEINILVINYPLNLLNPKFWFYALGTLIIPRSILRKMVDQYKIKIATKNIQHIKFEY